uniref:Uncharacterized protein n=1 Tax=Cannabis sativa TaxID=3483 RepID=A0A803PJT0_CANSA
MSQIPKLYEWPRNLPRHNRDWQSRKTSPMKCKKHWRDYKPVCVKKMHSPEEDTLEEPIREENIPIKKFKPKDVGPFAPTKDKGKGIMGQPMNKPTHEVPRNNKNTSNYQPLQKKKATDAQGRGFPIYLGGRVFVEQ